MNFARALARQLGLDDIFCIAAETACLPVTIKQSVTPGLGFGKDTWTVPADNIYMIQKVSASGGLIERKPQYSHERSWSMLPKSRTSPAPVSPNSVSSSSFFVYFLESISRRPYTPSLLSLWPIPSASGLP